MRLPRSVRLYLSLLLAPFPSVVKVLVYRHLFRYSIGPGVSIGLSAVDATCCRIESGVSIGHGNLITSVQELTIGAHTRIGHLNVIRGGTVRIGCHVEILRLNEMNALPDVPGVHHDSRLSIGDWTSITAGHKIDFTGPVTFGREVIVAGRNSSFWTHIRGKTAPITVGDVVYLGSEIRMAPGAAIPSGSVVGMGAVVVKSLTEYPEHVFAGVPARPTRAVNEKDRFLLYNRPPVGKSPDGTD